MWLTSMAVVAVGAALERSSPAASTDAAAADVCPTCPLLSALSLSGPQRLNKTGKKTTPWKRPNATVRRKTCKKSKSGRVMTRILFMFVCSREGSLLCLTNWIRTCRVPQVTNETQGHWNGLCSHWPRPRTPSTSWWCIRGVRDVVYISAPQKCRLGTITWFVLKQRLKKTGNVCLKKPRQTTVVIQYYSLSRFFWNRR